MLSIVVAYGSNRVIGVDGDLPWHLPTDMAFFREITMGHPVIMGRKTWESIPPKFRPLPGRRNLVLSRDPAYVAEGAEVFGSFEDALLAAEGAGAVIGGGHTYAEALPSVDRIYATEVELAPDGDTFFPELGDDFRLIEQRDRIVEGNGAAFTVRVYDRDRS
ncbi:MAG: dihydrofolate reductase [Solirubrobacteraceae bacterium]|nr:dihydrofolate reductase [Solirubrobacteraceae bacterium]